MIDWSPYFDYSSEEAFKRSLKLPLPTGLPVKFTKSSKAKDITELYINYENSDNIEDLITLLNIASREEVTIDENYKESAKTVIDYHNLYNLDDSYRIQEGIKNKVFSEMWMVGTNYSNMVSQTSPISIEDGQKAAAKAESFSNYINNNNPAAKAIAQFQNSIGKEGIGIAATGIKVYANTLTYVHSKLYNKKEWTIEEWLSTIENIKGKPLVNIKGLDLKGGYANIIPNVNYDNLQNSYIVDSEKNLVLGEDGNPISVLDIELENNITLRQLLEKVGTQEDVFLSISVLLSLATDNAKELVLEKINATPDLMGMYIYLLFRGATFADSAAFMTSPVMSLIKDGAKSNIFTSGGASNNIDSSIRYYLSGPNVLNYIPEKYVNSFRNAWYNYKKTKPELKEVHNDLLIAITDNKFIEEIDKFRTHLSDLDLRTNESLNSEIAYKGPRNLDDYYNDQSNLELLEEFDQEQDITEDINSTYINTRKNIKVLFNRYLNECITRNNKIQTLIEIVPQKEFEETIDIIKQLRKGANELTLLGKLSSLNQGIKTQLYEQINFLDGLTNSVNTTLKFTPDELKILQVLKIRQTLSDEQNEIYINMQKAFTPEELHNLIYNGYAYKQFDLASFVDNRELQEFYKHWYKYKSSFINVLDAILAVPHFGEMLKTFTTNNSVLDTLTIRRQHIMNINNELRELGIIKGRLTPRLTSNINRFLTDCIVNDYFKNLDLISIPNIGVTYLDGEQQQLKVPETINLNLENIDDRLTFKHWMEDMLINLFKTNTDNFAKNIVVKNFQNELKLPYTLCALDIDMSTMSRDINEARLSDIAVDYSKKHSSRPINTDLTFGDVLFLYNLIINKNSNSSYAFTNLFKDDLEDSNRMASKYIKYVSQLSKKDSEDAISYDIKDFILRILPLDQQVLGIEKKKNLDGMTELYYNGSKINLKHDPITNINTLLFTTDKVNVFSDTYILASNLSKYIAKGLAEFKLNCD